MGKDSMTKPLQPLPDKRFKPNSAKKLAELEGKFTYSTGKPCLKGHISDRYTKGARCVSCVSESRGRQPDSRQRSRKNVVLAEAARAIGKTTYIPEKPCKNGHLLRFVESNNCVACDELMRGKHRITQRYCRIRKEYGLDKSTYLNLVKEQNSSCKLCNKYVEDHFKLHVDHCHETKIVRGLLCNTCNQGIGLLLHSPELLIKAAAYCGGIC